MNYIQPLKLDSKLGKSFRTSHQTLCLQLAGQRRELCVNLFLHRDELCVIDWKTSLKPKPSLADCYDFPLQAAAYAGAVNQDPHYPIKVVITGRKGKEIWLA